MFKMIFSLLSLIFIVLSPRAHGEGNHFFINSLVLSDCQEVGQWNLAKGEVKVLDSLGNTQLHLAVLSNDVELVRYLLERGDEPNVQNESGETPLHLAVRSKDGESVRFLIDAGANPLIPNKRDETAFDWAVLDGNVEFIQLLFYRMIQIALKSADCVDGEAGEIKSIFQIFTL